MGIPWSGGRLGRGGPRGETKAGGERHVPVPPPGRPTYDTSGRAGEERPRKAAAVTVCDDVVDGAGRRRRCLRAPRSEEAPQGAGSHDSHSGAQAAAVTAAHLAAGLPLRHVATWCKPADRCAAAVSVSDFHFATSSPPLRHLPPLRPFIRFRPPPRHPAPRAVHRRQYRAHHCESGAPPGVSLHAPPSISPR